jgi:hypothetical protein
MRWDWDFLRNRRTEIDNRFRQERPAGKVITVNGHVHEIQGADIGDMEVAGRIRMLMRGQLDHESVCTLARDRIVYLADRLGEIEALTEADVTAGAAAIVDIWMGEDRSWRSRINDSDFLESADWMKALELSRAVLTARGFSQ